MKRSNGFLQATVVAGCALAVAGGAMSLGPLPPLGPFLDPWNGVWSVATTGELPDSLVAAIPGLDGPVRVTYDDRAVPHIFATSEADAMAALGYVTARDRLFQLELQTRATAGTLTEVLGPAALVVDRGQRRIGLAWSAERRFAELAEEDAARQLMTAYGRGVNAWISGMTRREVPFEFRLLGARPMEWRPQYSLYLLKRMGYTLAYQNLESVRLIARDLVGAAAADALFPVDNPIQEPIQTNGRRSPRLDSLRLPPPDPPEVTTPLARSERPAGGGIVGDMLFGGGPRVAPGGASGSHEDVVGSNNWAVGPIKTASGNALLAGDPHLNLTLPSIWYEVHLVVPGVLDVYGVSLPGSPGVVIGFNRDVAWSFTNTGADVMDFYAEEFDDDVAPRRYRLDGEWQDLDLRVESYRDRRGRVIAVDTLYHTHRGPVLMDNDRSLSLRWTVLESQGELDAFTGVAAARSVDEWLAAMAGYSAPAQNGLVADRAGSIAIRATGWFPVRPGDGRGDRVFDGTTRASDWLGYRAVDEYPFSIDPAQGFLASANQQPTDPRADPGYLGAQWPSPWRAMQINALLRGSDSIDADDMRRFQTHPGSARADAFVPAFLDAAESVADDTLLQRARELLGQWDRRYTRDNVRAVLFEAAMSDLTRRAWDELTREGADRPAVTPGSSVLASLLNQPASVWWDRRDTEAIEDRDAVLNESLRAALTRVRDRYGSEDGDGWRWSGVQTSNIFHLLRIPELSALGLGVQGGPSTLSPASGSGTHGASWRMVVELGEEVTAAAIYPGGQSGNPVSSRYDDRIETWRRGELEPVLFPRNADEIADRGVSRLRLLPGGDR